MQVSFHKNCSNHSIIEYCISSRWKIDLQLGNKDNQFWQNRVWSMLTNTDAAIVYQFLGYTPRFSYSTTVYPTVTFGRTGICMDCAIDCFYWVTHLYCIAIVKEKCLFKITTFSSRLKYFNTSLQYMMLLKEGTKID